MSSTSSPIRVGIFAASSVVPQIEFRAGLEHLRRNGFDARVEDQVSHEHFLWPGSDDTRADAMYRLATDPEVPILWAARGGYGAGRLLPILERLTQQRGVPQQRKLLVGYSDVTVLHEFVRNRWGWSTLHCPMPAAANFATLDSGEWNAILDYVAGKPADAPWSHATLTWLNGPPSAPIDAELIGGNLSLWVALSGTPWQPRGAGRIIFLEDLSEAFYRIDRMMIQLEQSGAFAGAAAIVLGDFTSCNDEDNQCLADAVTGAKKSLRTVYTQPQAFPRIFGDLGKRVGVPVAQGLPVGHGPNYAPLPLGARYTLEPSGKLRLIEWDWLHG